MQQQAPRPKAHIGWHLACLAAVTLISGGLSIVAWRVSGHEVVRIGTIADRIYVADGFHDREQNPEVGPYRWTEPLAQLSLPNWGPGRINVGIGGIGVASGEAVLSIGGRPLDRKETQAGQSWRAQAWGLSASRNPTVTLEGPRFDAPGDRRALGRLVTELEIFAPDARLRVLLNIALLGITGLLLYACLLLWSGRPGLALICGVAVPALYGPFAVYRDLWIDTVAWAAPLMLTPLLFLDLRRKPAHATPMRRGWAAPIAIVSVSAALSLLALGFMNAFDAERMYGVAAGLGEYGLPTRYPGLESWTKYGFGQPLIAVPFYWLGKIGQLLGGEREAITTFAVSLTNVPVTAFTMWLLYRGSRLFAPVGISLAVAATYLLSTPALNYARTFFSEPAGGLLLLASTLLLLPREGTVLPAGRNILLAGACLGAMVWFKPAFAIFLPAPGLMVLILSASCELRVAGRELSLATCLVRQSAMGKTSFNLALRRILVNGLLFSIGPGIALIVQGAYNYLRYTPLPDAILRTGYEKEEGFSTPLLEGLFGLLLSPGKSLFLYAPVILLAPLGLWLMARRGNLAGRVAVALILAQTAASLIFNALWWAWTGNFAWGPRLIMPVLPLLIWPLALLGRQTADGRRHETSSRHHARQLIVPRPPSPVLIAWAALATLGALVSIPGALVDFQVYYRLYGLLLAGEPGEAATIYHLADSPLLVEPGYLLNGLTAAIHRPTLASTGMPPAWDIIVPAMLVALTIFSMRFAARRTPTEAS